MREYTKALQAIQEAADHDTDKAHAKEIQQQEYKIQQDLFTQRGSESQEETYARAMRDPEVAVSIHDAVMIRYLLTTRLSGNHERSYHAANSPASTGRSCCAAGPSEEPHNLQEDSEAGRRWHHPNPIEILHSRFNDASPMLAYAVFRCLSRKLKF